MTRNICGRVARGMASILAIAAAPCSAAAFDLKGRNVQFYIGGGVGGAIDAVARTFAPYLARHLPGEPTLVCQRRSNFPSAGRSNNPSVLNA